MSKVSNSTGGDQTSVSRPLEPPTFQLPDDVGAPNSRWEVWSVRLPDGVSLADLDGSSTTVIGSTSTVIETSNGRSLVFQKGDPCENACFRILQPATKGDRRNNLSSSNEEDPSDDSDSSDHDDDKDDDDDDEDSKMYYQPSPVTFARHWNVVSYLPPLVETELAPSLDSAPTPSQHITTLRHAYAPVPQRTGLKRRWTPIGGTSHPTPTSVAGYTTREEQPLSRSPDNQPVAPISAKAMKSHQQLLLASTGGQEPGQATAAPDPESSSMAEHEKVNKRLAKKAKKEAKKKARKAHKHPRDK